MIIPHGNRTNQDVQTVVVAGPSVEPRRSVAVELPKVTTKPVAPQQASTEELKKAVEDINRAMQQANRNLQFSVDAEANRVVVRMTDAETGEVIRQIPSEETLAISRALGEFQQGLLLKQKA